MIIHQKMDGCSTYGEEKVVRGLNGNKDFTAVRSAQQNSYIAFSSERTVNINMILEDEFHQDRTNKFKRLGCLSPILPMDN